MIGYSNLFAFFKTFIRVLRRLGCKERVSSNQGLGHHCSLFFTLHCSLAHLLTAHCSLLTALKSLYRYWVR